MNPVITQAQVKQITHGRTSSVPIEYEAAVSALQSCINIDDAKYWGDKADALAAWAKLYRNDEAGRQAAVLKLHAYRRMGILAAELRPPNAVINHRKSDGTIAGKTPGPYSALIDSGLKPSQAIAARSMALLKQDVFEKAVTSPKPPSPTGLRQRHLVREHSDSWALISRGHASGNGGTVGSGGYCLQGFVSFCNDMKNDAATIARGLHGEEIAKARVMALTASEWLDKFEQFLPKSSEK